MMQQQGQTKGDFNAFDAEIDGCCIVATIFNYCGLTVLIGRINEEMGASGMEGITMKLWLSILFCCCGGVFVWAYFASQFYQHFAVKSGHNDVILCRFDLLN